jgi:Zn-dependent protease with chaperone function
VSAAGLYYAGELAAPLEVRWSIDRDQLCIEGDNFTREEPLSALRGTTRLGAIRRMVYLPDGAQLHSDDNDAVDALFPRRGMEAVVDRLERHPAAVASSMLVTVLAGVLFFFFGLPWLADRVARAIPPEVEGPIGEQVMAILDRTALEPTTLSAAEQARWLAAFDAFMVGQPDRERYRLEFRDMGEGVANAFAVPGGRIVFTDALLRGVGNDEEFLAVLAHELGHQVDGHVMRSVLQQSAVILLVAVFTGDVSAATGVAVAVPTFLLDAHYSRDFEREADRFAFEAMRQRGLSPEWFAVALSRIGSSAEGETEVDTDADAGADADTDSDTDTDTGVEQDPWTDSEPSLDYASSHPATADRLLAARAAAAGMPSLVEALARKPEPAALAESWPPRVAVDAAELVGCWRGFNDDPDWPYGWFAEQRADGSFEIHFDGVAESPSAEWSGSEAGTWSAHQGTIATHSTQSVDDASEAPIDAVTAYRIEAYDGATMMYRMLGGAQQVFGAERADCSEKPQSED